MRRWLSASLTRALAGLALALVAGSLPAQQEELGRDERGEELYYYRSDLRYRLEDAMAQGLDVAKPMSLWWEAEKLQGAEHYDRREQLYTQGFAAAAEELKPLPQAKWEEVPADVALQLQDRLDLPKDLWSYAGVPAVDGVECRVAQFTVSKLTQYGIVMRPQAPGKYPLILYVHGAAYGLPSSFLPVLAQLVAQGYVIAAPAFRGEDLFTSARVLGLDKELRCEGKIENLLGEPVDALAMAEGALKLDFVSGPKFAIFGHSFGSGAGLLVAARSDKVACVVSYDAWLVNPFRFYWERWNDPRKSYLWGSWEEFCEQPVPAQLAGLMARSIVHHADRVQAPMLLFVGGAYNGSAYHRCHADLVAALRKSGKTFRYEIVPGGDHNFVLRPESKPAQYAWKIQMEWLRKYHPPVPPAPPAPPVKDK